VDSTFSLLQKLVSLGVGRRHVGRVTDASGAAVAMLTNPIWVVKTRVFGTARTDSTAYKGLWGRSARIPHR
jgi:hypothetical protein